MNFIQENDFKILTNNLEKKLIDYIQPGLREILKKLASKENKNLIMSVLTTKYHPIILSLNHLIERYNQIKKDEYDIIEIDYDENSKIECKYDPILDRVYLDDEMLSYLKSINKNLEKRERQFLKFEVQELHSLDIIELKQIDILHEELDQAIEARNQNNENTVLKGICDIKIDQIEIDIEQQKISDLSWKEKIINRRGNDYSRAYSEIEF